MNSLSSESICLLIGSCLSGVKVCTDRHTHTQMVGRCSEGFYSQQFNSFECVLRRLAVGDPRWPGIKIIYRLDARASARGLCHGQ